MKKVLALFALVMVCMIMKASDSDYTNMEPLKLTTPEMKTELTLKPSTNYRPELELPMMAKGFSKTNTIDLRWQQTNEGVKPYEVMEDLTFVGVPLFLAGWAVKGDKAMFRVNNKEGNKNTQLLTDFKTGIDDYTQYFGPALTVGMKLGGYEGRSDWSRLLASAAMSYGIMAGLVNGIKYTAKEMRPDGSQANSWPSGHTATSFVGATLLHKEYGLTRSPWFSVAGYGVATATGVMRVLNNRHWISDVMSGAGIGIMSTELGYALSDVLFKGKGLLRNNLQLDPTNPSFFAISMGLGLGSKDIDFTNADIEDEWRFEDIDIEDLGYDEDVDYESDASPNIRFRAATVVDAEGAYFFNKYVGVGGRLRVRAMSAKSFGKYSELAAEDQLGGWMLGIGDMYASEDLDEFADEVVKGGSPVEDIGGIVKSDHLAEFSASLGLYFNLPLSSQFSLGTKLLCGRSFTQELDIDGFAKGRVKDIDYRVVYENGKINTDESYYSFPYDAGKDYSCEWNYLTVGAESSTTWGTGLSLTYRYKSNFAWRLFCDYDYTEKKFTMTYDPYHYLQEGLTPKALDVVFLASPLSPLLYPVEFKKKKKMNYVTLGLSFMVNL
ncbi:MAG: phosphatase PAP2 family protein [Prevotella sp.]|nr:phosphatase PAP2 family protein [Prevotella sp.]MBO7538040.1 phosphatase PAP2 family protein [Prevotella sp.]